MADTLGPRPTNPELDALRDLLKDVPAAVYFPATCRVYRCPNIWALNHECGREGTFTIPDAQLVAARIRAGELGPFPASTGPIVLAYGIPW